MKLHIKTLVFVTFFAFAVLGLQGQEKYEYLIIEANSGVNYAFVYKGGIELKRIDFDKAEVYKVGVINMSLREVQKLEDDGWELFNSEFITYGASSNNIVYFYKLRKKR